MSNETIALAVSIVVASLAIARGISSGALALCNFMKARELRHANQIKEVVSAALSAAFATHNKQHDATRAAIMEINPTVGEKHGLADKPWDGKQPA